MLLTSIIKKNNFIKLDWYIYYIYLYVFLTPLHLLKSQTAILSIILFLWGIYRYKNNFTKKFFSILVYSPVFVLFLFIGYQFLSVLWSSSIIEGISHVSNYNKYYFLFVPIILLSLNKNEAKNCIKILLLSFFLYSLFSMSIFFNIIEIVGSSTENPKGTLRFSISTQYMVMSFFISALFAFYSEKKLHRYIYILISLVSIFTLFINYSRTSQVAFILILIFFTILFAFKYLNNIKFYLMFLIIIIISFMSFSLNDRMFDRFKVGFEDIQRIQQTNNYEGSLGARIYFNKVGISILKENLFFGMGPVDNRKRLVEEEKNDPNYTSGIVKHFHSEHMEILTAYGLVGYLFIILSILLLIYKLKNSEKYYYLSISVFLTLFFVSFANKTLALKPLNYVYILFFILFAIIAYKSEENQKENIENHS